jgi:DNA-binding transcriptional MocR family regulator
VRELAAELAVSPATVAAAYRTLRQRALVTASGRRGTMVAPQPPLRLRRARPLPPGTHDLASGNPDPALLPPLAPVLARLDTTPKLYGGPAKFAPLVETAAGIFAADAIRGDVAILAGALDAVERALQAHLLPGDRVAVEDPSWPRINDLLYAAGFVPEPVALDRLGLLPDELDAAFRAGARAVIATPRGQNPTGAAVNTARARELRKVLGDHPRALVIEDDYVSYVAGAPYPPLHTASEHWIVVRSMSKVLGPDLRLAVTAGDPLTISRVEGRQLLGPGWISHILQQTVAQLLTSTATKQLLARAERTYIERRTALVDALGDRGIDSHGDSGLGVWIPVPEEAETVRLLLERGWAVSPGERYRFNAPPAIRVTTAALLPRDAEELAEALVETLGASGQTYAG